MARTLTKKELKEEKVDLRTQVAVLKKEFPEIGLLNDRDKQYLALAWYQFSRGNTTLACAKAEISWTNTWKKWLLDPYFKKIIDDFQENIVGMLESDLYNLAQKNPVALIFALTNLAPKKWKDMRNINMNVKSDKPLSDEQVKEMDSLFNTALNDNQGTHKEVRTGDSEKIPS